MCCLLRPKVKMASEDCKDRRNLSVTNLDRESSVVSRELPVMINITILYSLFTIHHSPFTIHASFLVLMAIMNNPNVRNTRPVNKDNLPDEALLRKLSRNKMIETNVKNNPTTKFSSLNLLYIVEVKRK